MSQSSRSDSPAPSVPVRRGCRRAIRRIFTALLLLALAAAGYCWWTRPGPVPPTEIFQGVVYHSQRLPETYESGGLMHVVEVDLTAPGIELYLTPVDPAAQAQGWMYRQRYVGSVARRENLAVAVNGATFRSPPSRLPLPGDWAGGGETVVSDFQVSHVHAHSYLLWFEDDLTPHLEKRKPPSPEALAKARWGIGGQEVLVSDGLVRRGTGRHPDRRTLLGIDPQRRRLWIMVFERASYHYAGQRLVEAGGKDAIMLDGGSSTAMVLGRDAAGIRSRVVSRSWRPVATVFGVRARPRTGGS